MNTPTSKFRHIIGKFSSKEYRDLYVNSHITNGLSFQIRGMRKDRKLSQKELAIKLGTKQEAISRLENPDYGKFTLETLKNIASVFDVALLVRFVPFSELAAKTTSISREDIDVPSYENDVDLFTWDNTSNIQYINEPTKYDSLSSDVKPVQITSTAING